MAISISPIRDWYYALLLAPSTQNTVDSRYFSGWTFVGPGTNTTIASGRMSGNTSTDLSIEVPGYASTAIADFVVVGWSANVGRDWNTVRAEWAAYGYEGPWTVVDPTRPGGNFRVYFRVYFGVSSVAQDVQLAPPGGPYNSVFGGAVTGLIPGLNLDFIPESSTPALVSVVIAAVLSSRRLRRR